jgi:glycosyltransferase involved in cell wall biosynthesis
MVSVIENRSKYPGSELNTVTILLVSYFCPTRAHAGGLRILDLYSIIKERYPQVNLVLYTHKRPEIDGSYDELPLIFDAIYFAPSKRLNLAWLQAHLAHKPCYDVVDMQFHEAVYDIASFRTVAGKIIFTPMESSVLAFILEIKSGFASFKFNSFCTYARKFKKVFEELWFVMQADEVICVANNDADCLRKLTRSKNIHCLETGISMLEFPILKNSSYQPMDVAHKRNVIVYVVFLGADTNIIALRWFLDNVHSLIKQQVPDYVLEVVGRGDTGPFKAYRDSSIQFIGEVPSVGSYIENAKVGIAPALGGAGFRGKINQYSIYSVPSVASTVSATGLVYRDEYDILIAETPRLFARRCVELLINNELNKIIGERARNTCLHNYTWDSKAAAIAKHYDLGPKNELLSD